MRRQVIQITFFPFGMVKVQRESTPGPLSNEQFSCWTFDMTPLCESLGDPTSLPKPPGKLTYPLKRDGLKRGIFTFQPSNIKGYVSFQRGFDICILNLEDAYVWWYQKTVNKNLSFKNSPACIGCIPVPLTTENESLEEGTNYFTVGTGPQPKKMGHHMFCVLHLFCWQVQPYEVWKNERVWTTLGNDHERLLSRESQP